MEAPIHMPDAPSGFSADSFFQGIRWHQRWEIFPGVFVPGRNDVKFLRRCRTSTSDLRGMRVLDVGVWHGCVSFECERRGAAEVIALSLEDPDVHGFNRLKDVLGSKVEYIRESVYWLSPEKLGKFDIVIFFWGVVSPTISIVGH